MKHWSDAYPTACTYCGARAGFYQRARELWCNVCGHLKGARKAIVGPPTSAPEIQARRLA